MESSNTNTINTYAVLLRYDNQTQGSSAVKNNKSTENIEELIEIGSELHGINTIISIRRNKKPGHSEVGSPTLHDYKSNESIGEMPSPKPASSVDVFGGGVVQQDLESMIFGGRMSYKDTRICKRREKQYLDSKSKKKYLHKENPKTTNETNKQMQQSIENNEPQTAELVPINSENENKQNTSNQTELMPISNKSDPRNKSVMDLKKAHPHDIKCEGCGNPISFITEYDNIICYKVPIKHNKLFYFHDSFCVTLRRLKESIRRYVLDQSLPEARRSETTIGYVRNLLTNFNPLLIGKHSNRESEQLKMMQFVRGSAHKLILRQQALENREAKNFDDEYSWKFKNIPSSIQYTDMVIYGPCLAKYIIQQLLSKQLESLWLTLAFVVSGMNASTALQIVELHRTDLAKVKEMEHLDIMLTSMIEAAVILLLWRCI